MTTDETNSGAGESGPGRRTRYPRCRSMSLAIDLWLRAGDLDEPVEHEESLSGAGAPRR